jgi:hypothetical protein
MKTTKTFLWCGLKVVVLACAASAEAQQVSELGSPSATTTIDGKQFPPPDPKFGGAIREKASPNSYSTGSVFTVKPLWAKPGRRHEVVPGPADTPDFEPWFHVAVVQFEDDGMATNPSQVQDAIATIRSVRRSSLDGAIVVVFIHGWHHSSAWNRTASTLATDADGDEHFHSFRLVLESLALRELERPHWRRVVGIYLSWNGDPVRGLAGALGRLAGPTTFRNRYAVAQRIGATPAFQRTLRNVVTTTKELIPVAGDDPVVSRPDSPLIMIGHSMGSLMLESGLLALLEDDQQPLISRANPMNTGAVQLKSCQGPVSLPDLILALNSAADSKIAKSIQESFERHQLEKVAAAGDSSFSPPIMMSVTSTGDTAMRVIWRLAQGVFAPWRKTDGHDGSLITHDFIQTARDAICAQQLNRDFGQNWHCLRRPNPLSGGSPAIPVDLPVRERNGVNDETVPHARYTITPRADTNQPRLIWVFQVPQEVIKNHNDIFNSKARSLILALIQISGAVASLAEDWGAQF